jgi:chemotaxis protein MotB
VQFFDIILQKSITRKFIVLTIFLVLIYGLTGCVSTSEYQNVLGLLDKTKHERDTLQRQKNGLKANSVMMRNRISDIERQAEVLGFNLEKTADSLSTKNRELEQTSEMLNETRSELTEEQLRAQESNQRLMAAGQALDAKEHALKTTQAELQKASAYMKRTHKLYDELVGELKGELKSKQVKIKQIKDGIIVNLSQEILFPSGRANLNKQGKKVLARVSERLKGKPYKIVIAGFTDNVAISGSLLKKFPSNWELAGARASSVVRLFEKSGISSSKLMATSYGENNAVASNSTAEGRKKNRRIEIRLRSIK